MATKKRSISKKATMREAVKRFKHEHLFLAHPSTIGFVGLFEDKKDGEDRVILLHTADADVKRLEREAKKYFAAFKWKLVARSDGPPIGTTFNGTDIWHDANGGHGTVGGWLKDAGGKLYGLSNNHVIAAINGGSVGDPILQGPTTIGTLETWITLKPMPQTNNCDLALFDLAAGQQPQWDPQAPAGSTGSAVGTSVYKKGARSGLTKGKITGVNGALNVQLQGQMFHFEGLIAIQADSGVFSEHGDSGSLVFTTNHLVTAVLFSKADGDPYSYAFPIGAAGALLNGKVWA